MKFMATTFALLFALSLNCTSTIADSDEHDDEHENKSQERGSPSFILGSVNTNSDCNAIFAPC